MKLSNKLLSSALVFSLVSSPVLSAFAAAPPPPAAKKDDKKDPKKAIENYCNALQAGGTKTLPQLFESAGLTFDFSPQQIKELMTFVNEELEKLF